MHSKIQQKRITAIKSLIHLLTYWKTGCWSMRLRNTIADRNGLFKKWFTCTFKKVKSLIAQRIKLLLTLLSSLRFYDVRTFILMLGLFFYSWSLIWFLNNNRQYHGQKLYTLKIESKGTLKKACSWSVILMQWQIVYCQEYATNKQTVNLFIMYLYLFEMVTICVVNRLV